MKRRNKLQPNSELLAADVKKIMEPLADAIETATAWGGYFDGEKKCEVDAIANQLIAVKRKMIDVVVRARTFEEFYEGR